MMFYINHNRIYCLWLNTHMLKSEKVQGRLNIKLWILAVSARLEGKKMKETIRNLNRT